MGYEREVRELGKRGVKKTGLNGVREWDKRRV